MFYWCWGNRSFQCFPCEKRKFGNTKVFRTCQNSSCCVVINQWIPFYIHKELDACSCHQNTAQRKGWASRTTSSHEMSTAHDAWYSQSHPTPPAHDTCYSNTTPPPLHMIPVTAMPPHPLCTWYMLQPHHPTPSAHDTCYSHATPPPLHMIHVTATPPHPLCTWYLLQPCHPTPSAHDTCYSHPTYFQLCHKYIPITHIPNNTLSLIQAD